MKIMFLSLILISSLFAGYSDCYKLSDSEVTIIVSENTKTIEIKNLKIHLVLLQSDSVFNLNTPLKIPISSNTTTKYGEKVFKGKVISGSDELAIKIEIWKTRSKKILASAKIEINSSGIVIDFFPSLLKVEKITTCN